MNHHELRGRRIPRPVAGVREGILYGHPNPAYGIVRGVLPGPPAYREPLADRVFGAADALGFAAAASAPIWGLAGLAGYYYNYGFGQDQGLAAQAPPRIKREALQAVTTQSKHLPLLYLLLAAHQHMHSAKYGRRGSNNKPKNGGSKLRDDSEAKDQARKPGRSQLSQRSHSWSLGEGSQLESSRERREFPLSTHDWRRQYPTTDTKHVSDDDMDALEMERSTISFN